MGFYPIRANLLTHGCVNGQKSIPIGFVGTGMVMLYRTHKPMGKWAETYRTYWIQPSPTSEWALYPSPNAQTPTPTSPHCASPLRRLLHTHAPMPKRDAPLLAGRQRQAAALNPPRQGATSPPRLAGAHDTGDRRESERTIQQNCW
jgi:hypothetical protein